MRADSITLAIFEKFSPEEKTTIAEKMATAQADLEAVESEKKVSDAAFNERIKKFAADVSTLAKQYNKGGETAQIGCDIRYDNPEPGKKSYWRMDRNEIVSLHDMTWEEKQETIQFPLNANAAEETQAQPTDEQVDEAINSLTILPADEEVTQICPHPGCTLFAEHDGDHAIAPPEENPDQDQAGAA